MRLRSDKGVAAIDLPLLIAFACATLAVACPEQVKAAGCVFHKAGDAMDSVVATQAKNNLPVGYSQAVCGVPSWMTKPPQPIYHHATVNPSGSSA